MSFDTSILSMEDFSLMDSILRGRPYGAHSDPDLVIAPDGVDYLYRWYVVRAPKHGNVYLHVQVKSDPKRPLHDHPWDNTSNILSGGYDEYWCPQPWLSHPVSGHSVISMRHLRKGDVCFRRAGEAHRLLLPSDIPYTMSLFSTGPEIREWGFWFDDGWHNAKEVTRLDKETRKSIHIGVQDGKIPTGSV